LGRYANYSWRLAVLFRLYDRTTSMKNYREDMPVPDWLCLAQDDLPPIARYMSMPHADAGVENFLIRGRVVIRDLSR
jgi:hypothetical protein